MEKRLSKVAVWLVVAGFSAPACQGQWSAAGGVKDAPPDVVLDIAAEDGILLDDAIPTPKSVLGFELGSRPMRYPELEQYLHRLAESSDRVQLRDYGTTHEGRTLYYVVISDAANMRRLGEIRAGLRKLADPRITTDDEAEQLVGSLPAVAWLAYTVHGDELSGTDAAVMAAYRLAAGRDDATTTVLESVITCINPLQNPDGRERYLAMMQQLGGKIPTGDTQSAEHTGSWPRGRTNHYLFDLNRDWNMTVQPESRGHVAAIQAWHPQLLVDAHEMWGTDTFLFSPPRAPLNAHIPPTVLKWTDRYSADQAAAFDQRGWSYYSGEWNEGWAIGFSDIWAKHHGAVGMLFEQARSDGSFIRLPTEQDRYYREDVAHQYVGSMANLTTLAENRQAILSDFYATKKRAAADEAGKNDRDVFLLVPGSNKTRAAAFLAMLDRQNIETFALPEGGAVLKNVTNHFGEVQAEKTFPAGTIAVSMKQPLSPLARAMLGFDPRPSDEFLKIERRELEFKNRSKFYDITGWCVSMCYDVDAYWADDDGMPDVSTWPPASVGRILDGSIGNMTPSADTGVTKPSAPTGSDAKSPVYGYVIDGADDASLRLVARLLQSKWKIRVARKPFTAGGRSYPPGSFLIRAHENTQSNEQLVEQLATLPPGVSSAVRTGRTSAGPDLGGGRFPLLAEPRIAIGFRSPFSGGSSGAIWHLLDAEIGIRTSRLSAQGLTGGDLRKYNVIVLPNAWGGSLQRMLDAGGRDRLERWVRDGGTLVAIGGTATALCKKKGGLGSVRLRRDVLDELDIYAEAVARTQSAAQPQFDINQVWDYKDDAPPATTQPTDATTQPTEATKKEDTKALKRWDAWARRFMPRGVLLRADLHPEHWLAHGMRPRVPVFYNASHVLMAMDPVQVIARLSKPESIRLSGLVWPEARRRLADGAYMTRQGMGRGQLILFAVDPVFRGYAHGTSRLFLNAVILGPGVGASTPAPW